MLCTFLSAPIMYISARMVLIHYASEDQYHTIISDVQRGVCILSAISVVHNFWYFIFVVLIIICFSFVFLSVYRAIITNTDLLCHNLGNLINTVKYRST